MKSRIISKLAEKKGIAVTHVVLILVILLLAFSIGYQVVRTFIIAQGVRDTVRNALIAEMADNLKADYGMREGVTASYYPDSSGNWLDNTTPFALASDVSTKLNLQNGKGSDYSVSDVSVNVYKPQKQSSNSLHAKATLTLHIPVTVLWFKASEITTPLTVQATLATKF